MQCPICGRSIPDNSQQCTHCGTDFAVLQESLLPKLPPEDSIPLPPAPEAPPKKRSHKPYLLGALAFLLILGIGITLASLRKPALEEGYIHYNTHYHLGLTEQGLGIAIGEQVIYDPASTSTMDTMRSLDGSVMAYLNRAGELYVVHDGQVTFVAKQVSTFQLSSNGKALLYNEPLTTNALYYYDIGTGQATALCSGGMTRIYERLSPNGKFAAFTAYDPVQEQVVLMFFDGQVKQLATDIHEIHSISDDGKYIYCSARNGDADPTLYCIDSKGKKTLLGSIGRFCVYANADCTQLLFYRTDGSYISTFADTPVKISDEMLIPLMPSNTQDVCRDNTYTMPAKNLFDQVYLTTDQAPDAYYISQDGGHLLAESIDYYILDDSGKYLYYLQGGGVRYKPVDSPDAGATVVASGVLRNFFALSPDRSLLAYFGTNGIYQTSGTVSVPPTQLNALTDYTEATNPSLMYSLDNVLYISLSPGIYAYLPDGSMVYMMDAYYIRYTANRLLYISSFEGEFLVNTYIAKGAVPSLLWSGMPILNFV